MSALISLESSNVSNNSVTEKAYRLNDLIIEPELNTIHRVERHAKSNSDAIRVEPKVMQLLTFLVQNQGEVCSKQHIIDEIWPRQIVADDAVTRLVFVLRNALGDDAKSPTFISTIPKKGYVLFASAQVVSAQDGDDKKANKTPLSIGSSLFVLLAIVLLSVVVTSGVTWFQTPPSSTTSSQPVYEIVRSLPVTHQEGREYSFARSGDLWGYLHEHNNQTAVMVSDGEKDPQTLLTDKWQKRSLIILGAELFYIRFWDGDFQIVQQSMNGELDVLFESETPIYSLSFDSQSQKLLFNHYQNNDSIKLFSYSFVSEQVSAVTFDSLLSPNKMFLPYYHDELKVLFFVGMDGRNHTIYGLNKKNDAYLHQISAFRNITDITAGQTKDDLLIAGVYQFTQGIWSVSLITGEISLVFSHQDNVITQIAYNSNTNVINYSFQGQRVDLKEVDLLGQTHDLTNLNSTLTERSASYSPDGKSIYFASNREGDFELFQYEVSTASLTKVSGLNARAIWRYSFSTDGTKLAVVYSKEQIYLGVIDLLTGDLLNKTQLDELKFPLGWSKDDRHIYVSEHLSNIAMYVYNANTLEIKKKRTNIGLTAVETNSNEIIAFDYQTNRFVTYNFNTNQIEFMSNPVKDPMQLAPANTRTDGKDVMILYRSGMQKSIYRLTLSTQKSLRTEGLVANLLQSGRMQAFSPDLSRILMSDTDKAIHGNIVSLKLK